MKKDKKKKQEIGLSTTVMVDVLFILLTFFILVSTIKKDNITVTPTKVKKAPDRQDQKQPHEQIVITIDAKDQVYLNGEAVGDEQLREKLSHMKRNTPKDAKIEVVFRTDGNSRNRKTTQVLGVLSEQQLIDNLQWEAESE